MGFFLDQIRVRCFEALYVALTSGCRCHTSVMMILPFSWMVLLLTMPTIATPRLHRIPKEMQKPRPLMMAMMYRRGRPQQLQSHSGGFFSAASRGRPSSVSSITSPVFCFLSINLQQPGEDSLESSPDIFSSYDMMQPKHVKLFCFFQRGSFFISILYEYFIMDVIGCLSEMYCCKSRKGRRQFFHSP